MTVFTHRTTRHWRCRIHTAASPLKLSVLSRFHLGAFISHIEALDARQPVEATMPRHRPFLANFKEAALGFATRCLDSPVETCLNEKKSHSVPQDGKNGAIVKQPDADIAKTTGAIDNAGRKSAANAAKHVADNDKHAASLAT